MTWQRFKIAGWRIKEYIFIQGVVKKNILYVNMKQRPRFIGGENKEETDSNYLGNMSIVIKIILTPST